MKYKIIIAFFSSFLGLNVAFADCSSEEGANKTFMAISAKLNEMGSEIFTLPEGDDKNAKLKSFSEFGEEFAMAGQKMHAGDDGYAEACASFEAIAEKYNIDLVSK